METFAPASNEPRDWQSFTSSWGNLGLDLYMADGGRYRRRRFAAFHLTRDLIERKPHQPHYQSRDYNPLNGDIERWFEPVLPEIATNTVLLNLLRTCQEVFDKVGYPMRGRENFLSVKRALFSVNHSSASSAVPGHRDLQSVALSRHAHWSGYSFAVMFGRAIEL